MKLTQHNMQANSKKPLLPIRDFHQKYLSEDSPRDLKSRGIKSVVTCPAPIFSQAEVDEVRKKINGSIEGSLANWLALVFCATFITGLGLIFSIPTDDPKLIAYLWWLTGPIIVLATIVSGFIYMKIILFFLRADAVIEAISRVCDDERLCMLVEAWLDAPEAIIYRNHVIDVQHRELIKMDADVMEKLFGVWAVVRDAENHRERCVSIHGQSGLAVV